MALPDYAELRCVSNFTFLDGASWPDELVERAKELGYSAIAVTDECTLAGVVRAHVEAKKQGIKLLVGSQFRVAADLPFTMIVLAQTMKGYGNLCQFITRLRRTTEEKGTYLLQRSTIEGEALAECLVIVSPDRVAPNQQDATDEQLEELGRWMLTHCIGRAWIGVEQIRRIDDELWLYRMRQLSALTDIPLVALGDVHMHVRSRKPLQDVLTATRVQWLVRLCAEPFGQCLFASSCQRWIVGIVCFCVNPLLQASFQLLHLDGIQLANVSA